MSRTLRIPLLGLLLVCLASWTYGASPQEPTAPPAEEPLTWSETVQRDKRVSFSRRSGQDAYREILAGDQTPMARAIALISMGCTRPQMVRERGILEANAKRRLFVDPDAEPRTVLERQAALLALGEFGEGAEAALTSHLEDDDPSIRACAMLGLLLTERRSARRAVEEIAARQDDLGRVASDLLVFSVDPAGSRETEASRLLLDLRWQAARKYGLIDGESWSTRALADLIATPRFLNGVVLASVAGSQQLGVKDHLLARLVDTRGTAELRAAVHAMPDELAAMIESGLWDPRGTRAWKLMLEEIDEGHLESKSLSLLSLALDVPAVEVQALMLLARASLPQPLIGLEDQWPDLNSRDKRLACEAWALAESTEALTFLKEFVDDPDADVRAAVMVTRARLGDIEAHFQFRTILQDPEHEMHVATFGAALDHAEGPLVRTYLEDLLEKTSGEKRLLVARALAETGVARARNALAEELRDGFPPGREGVLCVRALVGRDAAAFLDLFRRSFPAEDDLLLNIALASAIVSAQDDYGLRIIRPALWSSSFDLSILAGLAIVRMQGLYGLRDELNRIPVDASTADLRRIGFALGQWGGIQEVELLRRHKGYLPNSPVLQGALLAALSRRTH